MARQTPEQAPEQSPEDLERAKAELAEAEAREARRDLMDRSGQRLEVRGPVGGRWRAGMHFTPVPVIIEPGVLTKADRDAIDSDALLSVRAAED